MIVDGHRLPTIEHATRGCVGPGVKGRHCALSCERTSVIVAESACTLPVVTVPVTTAFAFTVIVFVVR